MGYSHPFPRHESNMNPDTSEYFTSKCDSVAGNIKNRFTPPAEENMNSVLLNICFTCHDVTLLNHRVVNVQVT